jgi:hypothetical protein
MWNLLDVLYFIGFGRDIKIVLEFLRGFSGREKRGEKFMRKSV